MGIAGARGNGSGDFFGGGEHGGVGIELLGEPHGDLILDGEVALEILAENFGELQGVVGLFAGQQQFKVEDGTEVAEILREDVLQRDEGGLGLVQVAGADLGLGAPE